MAYRKKLYVPLQHIVNSGKSVALRVLNRTEPKWGYCVKCGIGRLADQHVFWRGTLPCDVLFIGEAPGKEEDREGFPFVGKSGKLLDQMINAVQFGCYRQLSEQPTRFSNDFTWAVTNVVCCRPTDKLGGPNRPPSPREVENCLPRLDVFVRAAAAPKAIICLGRVAEKHCDGRFDIPMRYIYHPSFIIRQGGLSHTLGKMAFDKAVRQACRFLGKHGVI